MLLTRVDAATGKSHRQLTSCTGIMSALSIHALQVELDDKQRYARKKESEAAAASGSEAEKPTSSSPSREVSASGLLAPLLAALHACASGTQAGFLVSWL